VFYNGTTLPEDCRRKDVQVVVKPFTELADQLGEPRAGNMVMLGALLESIRVLSQEHVFQALARLVKSARWLEIDRKALLRGRKAVQTGGNNGRRG
jgi:Pyruvate/2-oxoacid:ferredoxin oxidoreductase gamma subunit